MRRLVNRWLHKNTVETTAIMVVLIAFGLGMMALWPIMEQAIKSSASLKAKIAIEFVKLIFGP